VHRLVLDQLFQQRGRGVPGDALQFEEADVEPRREARFQLAVERRQLGVVLQVAQQVGAQVDEELDALRDGVELRQYPDPRRAQRGAQLGFGIPLRRPCPPPPGRPRGPSATRAGSGPNSSEIRRRKAWRPSSSSLR
jgi:hypothetical protein